MIRSLPYRHGHGGIQHGTATRFERGWIPALFLVLAASLIQLPHAVGADSYTEAIEAEGNRLEFLGQARKEQEALMRHTPAPVEKASKNKATDAKKTAHAPTASPASVTQQEFEKALRGSFPGSFALYSVLEPGQKESVFHEYQNTKTEGTIRFLPAVNKIIALSSKSKPR